MKRDYESIKDYIIADREFLYIKRLLQYYRVPYLFNEYCDIALDNYNNYRKRNIPKTDAKIRSIMDMSSELDRCARKYIEGDKK